MEKLWEAAAYPANPHDLSGYMYAMYEATPVRSVMDKFYHRSGFSYDKLWQSFPYAELEAIRYDNQNYFKTAISSPAFPLSANGKQALANLINILIANEQETDYSLVKAAIVAWEDDILANSSQYTRDELIKLLSAASTGRHGALIWLPSAHGNVEGKGFWSWVGAIVGAVVAVVLAPVIVGGAVSVAGYIIFGTAGAIGGYYLAEAITND